MRYHFVVNPVSGRRRSVELAEGVARRLSAAGHATTFHRTSGPGDARRHVAGLDAAAFDRLVVAGGDGTLREVVNSRPSPLPWPVAMLPGGTANLVTREVAFPLARDAEEAYDGLARAEPWAVGLIEVRRAGRLVDHAVATVGVGLDGEIVHRVSELRARARQPGTGGYRQWVAPMLATFRTFRFPLVEATIDGRATYRGTAVVAQHARTYGGIFAITPRASLDGDTLHVVVARSRSRRDLPRLFAGALRGRVDRYHDVRVVEAREVAIRALQPVRVQADGDPAGTTDLELRLRPGALTLLRVPGSAR